MFGPVGCVAGTILWRLSDVIRNMSLSDTSMLSCMQLPAVQGSGVHLKCGLSSYYKCCRHCVLRGPDLLQLR